MKLVSYSTFDTSNPHSIKIKKKKIKITGELINDNYTFLITQVLAKLHGLKLFLKNYNFSKICEIIFN